MKNYWIKVNGQWRIVGDTRALKQELEQTTTNLSQTTNNLAELTTRVGSSEDDIIEIKEALGIGDSGSGSGTSVTQQLQNLSTEITNLKVKDTQIDTKDTEQDNSILGLKKTLGLVDDSGSPTEESVLDKLTDCCDENKENITTVQTTLNGVKSTVDELTDTSNPNSIAKQLDVKASELQSNIDDLSSKHDEEIERLETVIGLTVKDGKVSSKFDGIAIEQSNQDERISVLEGAVGLGGEGGQGSSITQQVIDLRSDVDEIKDTLGNETTGHTKRIEKLESENESQESDISDIKDILGIIDGEDGNPVSEVLQNAADCCKETKESIKAAQDVLDKLTDPEDEGSISKQLASVKEELESSISGNTTLIQSNTTDITALKEKDGEHDDEIGKLKNALGLGEDGDIEDASLTAQVGTLRSDIKDIKEDIGDWTGDKTIAEAISSLDECCTDSKSRLNEVEEDITGINSTLGNVPEGSNLQQQITNITNLVGTVSGEITETHEERLDSLKEQADATDTEVSGIKTSITDINDTLMRHYNVFAAKDSAHDTSIAANTTAITNLTDTYNEKIALLDAKDNDFEARITANANNIASNDQDIEDLQAQDAVLENSKIAKSGSRGSLNGFETVNTVPNSSSAVLINIDSADTTLITANTAKVTLSFTPGETSNCSVKVITIKNTVETSLDTGGNAAYTPKWANNNDAPEWGTLADQLLILIAHFIGGEIVLTVFHNSEA